MLATALDILSLSTGDWPLETLVLNSAMAEGVIRIERDIGGWEVRRSSYIDAWAEREKLWPNRTIAEFSLEQVRADPDRIILIDETRELSCGYIYRHAAGLAAYMLGMGIRPGDVVSFQLPNWWEASAINLAAAMIGAVANPILPINRHAEVSFILKDTGSRLLFIPSQFRRFSYGEMAAKIRQKDGLETNVVEVRGDGARWPSFEEVCGQVPPLGAPLRVDANSVKLIMYTSGTTGRGKGVLHSHNSINADSVKMQAAIGLTPSDASFIPSPVTHVTGYLWVLNVPWCCNIPAVTIDTWDADRAFDLLEIHGCAFMAGATPFLRDIVAVAQVRDAPLPKLRNYLCGGASVPHELIYSAAEVFPNCIPWRNYGSTEAPTLTRGPISREELRLGAETDGRIYQAEVVIRDTVDGKRKPEGEPGEIFVREPSMALGYVHADDNAGAYDEQGFFRMGDVGRIIDGDHIVITDRLKDIIIRSGENLSSKEIEDALLGSPLITDAAVVAVPNNKTGEAVFAFLVLQSGAKIEKPDLIAMIDARGLARQKTPEFFQVVSELPRTASGKVIKHQLRDQAKQICLLPEADLQRYGIR